MPPMARPRSATAKLSWTSHPASPSKPPAPRRPASARHLPPGRTTKTELEKLLLEAEEDGNRPPPPPKPVSDADIMEQQRSEWMAKDKAFERAAKEREREEQRIRATEHQQAELAKVEKAIDDEHNEMVQARLRRLGLAGDGKAKARLRNAILKAKDVGDDGQLLTKPEAQRRDTLKVLSSFRTGTYQDIEREVERNFKEDGGSPAPCASEDVEPLAPVTDSDFELGLANAKDDIGDRVHADMFCKLHAVWLSACDAIPIEESKQENDRVRDMVVARFRRYQNTWPKSEENPEEFAIAQYLANRSRTKLSSKQAGNQHKEKRSKFRPRTAPARQRMSANELRGRIVGQAERRRRPQSGPARQGAANQCSERKTVVHRKQATRPASGPPRVGWSAEADAYVARLGLVPPLGRPPSAQPVRSGDRWIQQPQKQHMTRPVSAPARLAATVVARWSHHVLGYALRGWRDAAEWRANARQRVRYCVSRMMDDRLYRCIDRWRAQITLQKRAKQLLRRTLLTWNNQTLVNALNSWKAFIAAEANKYGRMLAMWKGDGRRTYFNMWKDAVELIKDKRPASHGFFQSLGVATFRGVETAPEVWRVGQLALQSDSDDSSDSGGENEVKTPHARRLRRERRVREKRIRREAAERGGSDHLRRISQRGLSKRLMRYYDGSGSVDDGTHTAVSRQGRTTTSEVQHGQVDQPLAWSELEMSAVHTRQARVPTAQALTRQASHKPSPYDILTAALEGRHRDTPGASMEPLGYLGPVAAGRKTPIEGNVYDEDPERGTVVSEKPEPEREVEERAKELYSKTDTLGQLQYEGRWISHAYRPSVSRVDNRRGAVSTAAEISLPVAQQNARRSTRQKGVFAKDDGERRARSAYLSGGLSQPQGLIQHDEGKLTQSQRLAEIASAAAVPGRGTDTMVGSCMDAATAAAAAVAAMAVQVHSGVSAAQASAALARKQRLAQEREYGWQLQAAKLDETRLIAKRSGRRRGIAVDKRKRASLWQSARAASTSVCVIC